MGNVGTGENRSLRSKQIPELYLTKQRSAQPLTWG